MEQKDAKTSGLRACIRDATGATIERGQSFLKTTAFSQLTPVAFGPPPRQAGHELPSSIIVPMCD